MGNKNGCCFADNLNEYEKKEKKTNKMIDERKSKDKVFYD